MANLIAKSSDVYVDKAGRKFTAKDWEEYAAEGMTLGEFIGYAMSRRATLKRNTKRQASGKAAKHVYLPTNQEALPKSLARLVKPLAEKVEALRPVTAKAPTVRKQGGAAASL